jgi:N-acetylglutamate synthase-like GNAT family acetyltransferase
MQARPIRHRRGRRTDLMDILRLLTQAEKCAPVPDRALLRRFRRIVSDLGNDLYVALVAECLVGFVHLSYRRHITLGLRGRVESLIVSEHERPQEVGKSLVLLAEQRARRRNCFDLSYTENVGDGVSEVMAGNGWVCAGRELRLDLSPTSSSP